MLISIEEQIAVLKILKAESPVRPPGPFNFMPKNWCKWKRRFRRYLTASGANVLSEQVQINLLLYLLGPQAEELFLQLQTLEENREILTLDEVVEQLDRHFHLVNRPLYARFLFHRRMQRQYESVNEFLRVIHLLAEACDFGDDGMKAEMLRDKVVVGMRDDAARQRLFLYDNLTLEQAIAAARNAEIRQVRMHGCG